MIHGKWRDIPRSLFVLLGTLLLGISLAGEAGEKEGAKRIEMPSDEELDKMDCEEIQSLASVLQNIYHSIWTLQKKVQERRYADGESLNKWKDELKKLESETEEEAFSVFEGISTAVKWAKVGKEVGELGVASGEVIEVALEKAIKAGKISEGGIQKMEALKDLSKYAKFATKPATVIGFFGASLFIEASEAIWDSLNRGKHGEGWNNKSIRLSDAMGKATKRAANAFARLVSRLKAKKCAVRPEKMATKCFGKACSKGVIADADFQLSKNRWYDFKPSWGLGYDDICGNWEKSQLTSRISSACDDEYKTMLQVNGHGDKANDSDFKITRALITENKESILDACALDTCNACAVRSATEGTVGQILGPARERLSDLGLTQYQDPVTKRGNNLAYCRETFSPKAMALRRAAAILGPREYHGKSVAELSGWPSLPSRTPADMKRDEEARGRLKRLDQELAEKAAHTVADERDARLAQNADYVKRIRPPFKTPKGQPVVCECFASCLSGTSRLGYPVYLFSKNPMVVRDCEKGTASFENLTGEKFCKEGETTRHLACQWRQTDEPKSTVRSFKKPAEPLDKKGSPNYVAKCEWGKWELKEDDTEVWKPYELKSGDVVRGGRSVADASGANPKASEAMNKILRVLAACSARKIDVSFCFQDSNQWYIAAKESEGRRGGYRNECWTTQGETERRAELNGKYTPVIQEDRYARADGNRRNFFATSGGNLTAAGDDH